MKIVIRNGYYHIKYYESKYGHSRTKKTGLKATQANRAAANKALKNFNQDFISGIKDRDIENLRMVPKISELKEEIKITLSYADSTKSLYDLAVRHWVDVNGDDFINRYTSKHFVKFLKHISGKSQNTKSIYTRHLHHLFEVARKKKYVAENIIIRQPEQLKGARPIPENERKEFFEKVKEKRIDLYLFAALQSLTGSRASTLVELTKKDILWEDRLIRLFNVKIDKTEYYHPITNKIQMVLNECKGYIDSRENKIFPWQNSHAVIVALKREGIFIKLHRLKHSYVSDMVNRRINLEDVSKITNTTSRTLRKYYTQFDIQRIAKNIDDSDEKF